MEHTIEELKKQNLELKEKLIKIEDFLKTVAEMLEIDGIGYDGPQLSLDDFAEKITVMHGAVILKLKQSQFMKYE